jgi:hypothetical protein
MRVRIGRRATISSACSCSCPPESRPSSAGSTWSRFTEWAADDRAVDGDSHRSLCLAAALVRVARLAPAACPSPAITSLLGQGRDLAARVERLLHPAPSRENPEPAMPAAAAGASVALTALLLAVLLQPSTLYSVHRWLEELIH